MSSRRTVRAALALVVAMAGLVAASAAVPAQGDTKNVDPAALARGANAAVAHLVRNTIRDGGREVAATRRGKHLDLWTVRRGYVLNDWVRRAQRYRLVHVDRAGHKRLVARMRDQTGIAVSSGGRRIAWGEARGELGPPMVVRVANPNTGRILAGRRFYWGFVAAVSKERVLLTRRGPDTRATTWWWNYRTDRMSKVSNQAAIRADLEHNRVVLATGPADSFCNRVAPLAHPTRTLWRSCRITPHDWTPRGGRALATHTYFDDAGTDRWLVVGDRTRRRVGRVTGRLDWDAVWEDDRHFLTMAQSDAGKAAVIRCTVAGRCERASRLWHLRRPDYQPNYIAPPVVLAGN